ncbi:sugar dehydrogenase complex small subunit [Roseicyclus mahoneyensis]|jgi:fructose 5-dehydrogenase small subunit|uniref:D-sorbitol dehydrogenase-like protein n=1 Tax=Roseicyclus mahoneyensis TaxID=164332 RepID=A0A316GLA0_9RHOB|nr:sugar dehydrogenase complex small subunit [Roseicyclus mahoneyensis]PWK61457.1 D-sorbitol dehydrogenase-like protein [Roseicyclus mahoneyensis]
MTHHPSRRLVLGGMVALHAVALARIAPGQTPLPSRTGPIGAEDFMALSQRMTGHDRLSPTLGARFLEVLAETGRAPALQTLYASASGASGGAPEDQDDIVQLLLHGWYLGRIEIDGQTHLIGYEQTLMGRVTADILPLRSYCGGTMGFWALPPDTGPLPLREAQP